MNEYDTLAAEIMPNYPEYSFCVTCTSYDYKAGIYGFVDEETGKQYTITTAQIAEVVPKLRAMIAEKKLFLDGLHSGEESFFEAGNWDAIATDAAVQLVMFGDVIYG